jgi:hypothetical protein
MVYKVAYLIKAYDILATLVINIDQIGVHLIPTRGERTWEMKGKKNIHILGIDDKKQIIVAISSLINGNLLPLPIIFKGSTIKCLLPKTIGKVSYLITSFHLMYSINQWSTLETSQQFVKKDFYSLREKSNIGIKFAREPKDDLIHQMLICSWTS